MKRLILLFAIISVFTSCSEDESSKAEIVDFNVTAVSNENLVLEDISIVTEEKKVFIFFNNNLNDYRFPISLATDVKLSSGAKVSSILSEDLNFTHPDEVLVIPIEAENGDMKNWYVYLVHQQLQNSGFENWFDNKGMNGASYQEIGSASLSSVWSTANMGTSTYSVYNTKSIQNGDNLAAEIKTQTAGKLPITAGTVFTGIFSLADAIGNPSDPEKATHFGTPFIFRPSGFKFKFKYKAGEYYVQASLDDPTDIFGGFSVDTIPSKKDQCSIYAFLEIRNGDQITEIARVKMETSTTDDVLTEKTLMFDYTSSENPTHISIVFSSSTGGALWTGAVGSTLVVDDLELIYD